MEGNILKTLKFSKIASNGDLAVAVAGNSFTARLLSMANALDAVVKVTGNRAAAKQLKSLAWQLCQRSGGNVCESAVECKGSCSCLSTGK